MSRIPSARTHATLNLAVDSDAQQTLVNSAAVKIGGARGCGVVSAKGGKVSAKRRLDCLVALGLLANQKPGRASAISIRSCQHETSKARRKTLTRTLGLTSSPRSPNIASVCRGKHSRLLALSHRFSCFLSLIPRLTTIEPVPSFLRF